MLHYTFEDGLPSNTIYQVYRDSKDFLWVATDKGVARYNGIKFEVFTMADGLPDNEIYFFREDHDGRLWIATSNGKLCFYKNDTFHTALNTQYLRLPSKEDMITVISIEYDSSVSFLFYNKDVLVNINKEVKSEINISRVTSQNILTSYLYKKKVGPASYKIFYRDGNLTIDTSNKLVSVVHSNLEWSLRPIFSQDQDYIISDKFIYNNDMQVIRSFSNDIYKKIHFYAVYNDSHNFFYATHDGLFMNDTLTIIKDMEVSSITQDVLGNYWIGTLFNGLFCIRKDFLTTRIYNDIFPGKIRYCKSLGSHIFYTATDNNLYDFHDGKVKVIFDYKKFKKRKYSFRNDAAYFIDDNYNYYNTYNLDDIVVKNVLSVKPVVKQYSSPFFSVGVKTILADDKKMFLKTRDHVYMIDFENLRNKETIGYMQMGDSTVYDRVYGFANAMDKKIWYSSMKSMFKIRGLQSVRQPQFNDLSLKAFEFLGKYMVGYTFDNRLLIFSNLDGTFKVDSSIPNLCVWNKLYKLNDSMMLISTNNFDRLLTIHEHRLGHPVSISIIEDPFVPLNIEAFCTDGSNCYFFKNGAITSMSINSLLKKSEPPKLYFSLMRMAKQTYHITNDIEIPYKEIRNIAVSFAACSFAGNNVSYLYSVSKTRQDIWRPLQGQEINLLNPGYGNYTIKVKAKTMDSEYCEPIFFTLHILKPYWATWWFITLSVIAAIVIIGAVVRYRILHALHKKERTHESEIKFLKLEYKALNALMNPHFIFNALNNVQGLINKNEKLAANKYLGIFATLIRQNMHNISLELIPLHKEIEMVTNYLKLEKLRFKDHLNYAINADDRVDLSEIMIPPLLIQPLVENAIKHGIFPRRSASSFICIDIYEQDNLVIIAVKDNGIGIEAARKRAGKSHQSYGLENIRKRIAQLAIIQNKHISLHISDIKDDAGKLQWTVVSININLS